MRKWIVAFTAVFLTLLVINAVPELRGGWGWRWPYAEPERWSAVAILIACLVAYGVGVWAMRRWDIRPTMQLLWAVVGAFVLALAVQNIRNDPFFMLFSHTVSPVQTGASTVATRFLAEEGAHDALNRWPDVMRESKDLTITHFTTSPPGKALLHHWLAETVLPLEPVAHPVSMALRPYQCSTLSVMEYDRGQMVSAGAGMLMPLWAALAVFPIFVVARQLSDDRKLATRMAMWWALVPSLLLFAPTWNTLYPLLAVGMLALLIAALRENSLGFAVGAGVVMSIATFLNFAVLPLIGFAGFFALLYWYFLARNTHNLLWILQIGAAFGIGLLSTWLLFFMYTGLTPLDLIAVTFDEHLDIERNYWTWLVLHVYDMLMFAGWPLALLGLWGIWRAMWRLRRRETLRLNDVLSLSLLLTIIVLDISGITRAESARIWLFFVPLLLLSAVDVVAQFGKWWDTPLFAAQLVTVAVMGSALPVVAFDMNLPVEGPRTDLPLIDYRDMNAVNARFVSDNFDGEFSLTGYRFVADPSNQTVTLEIQWQGQQRTERPYIFELIAYATNPTDGDIVSAPLQWYPQNGNYLTTCWQAGDVVHDVLVVDVPPVSEPVQWTIEVQAIHLDDEMTVRGIDSAENRAVLGPIPYP